MVELEDFSIGCAATNALGTIISPLVAVSAAQVNAFEPPKQVEMITGRVFDQKNCNIINFFERRILSVFGCSNPRKRQRRVRLSRNLQNTCCASSLLDLWYFVTTGNRKNSFTFTGHVDGSTFDSGEIQAEMKGDQFLCKSGISSYLPGKTLFLKNDQ
jgi:hypothetical protein